ncbi:MAG: sporulation transcription factor Spo0A [Firmicutes bacterium]|nr:sporulation transcription factor Spo0A [Bacillota bacterium]
MKRIKVVIAEGNFEEKNALKEMFERENKFEIVSCVDDGAEALQVANDYKVDMVISNFALKRIDGITLCEKIKSENENIKMVMLSSAFSDFAVKRMVEVGVDHYTLRPFEGESFVRNMLYLFDENMVEKEHETVAAQTMAEFPPIANKRLEDRLANIFISMGIPAHIKGYKFLNEAIKLTMQTPGIINSITKQLYPTIAKHYETSASKVERAIRHAIEVSFNRGRIEIINEIFKVKAFSANDRPTNGEFIALIAEKLLIEGLDKAN